MGTLDGAIGPGYTSYALDKESIWRRIKLKVFAQSVADSARQGTITDLEGFARVASAAAAPFQKPGDDAVSEVRCEAYLEDLRRVLIGDGWHALRNHGKYALPFNAFRDSGFKPEFRDGGNQVQHAMAGIYITYIYGFYARHYAYWREKEAPDLALYDATFQIGLDIDGSNFTLLPIIIRNRLGA